MYEAINLVKGESGCTSGSLGLREAGKNGWRAVLHLVDCIVPLLAIRYEGLARGVSSMAVMSAVIQSRLSIA
jgi:hypothetical protein